MHRSRNLEIIRIRFAIKRQILVDDLAKDRDDLFMRITLEFDEKAPKPQSTLLFDDADTAVQFMEKSQKSTPNVSVILTREAAQSCLEKYYEQLDALPFQLMREIHPMDDEPNDEGSLNFTNVQEGNIESIHDSLPCGAREGNS